MSDTMRRTLRTFIQAFIGALLTSGVLSAFGTDGVVDFAIIQKGGVAALGAALTAAVTFVQNALEDKQVIPEVVSK
jgi:hypothetical protein